MPKNRKDHWEGDRNHFNKNIKMVLYLVNRQIKILEYPKDEDGEDQIVLTINPMGNGGIGLSHLTEEELDALVMIFNMAIEMARPIVQKLDAAAEEARLRNDTRYRRLYRSKPQFIDLTKESHNDRPPEDKGLPAGTGIQGTVGEHAESVPSRPDGSDEFRDSDSSGDDV